MNGENDIYVVKLVVGVRGKVKCPAVKLGIFVSVLIRINAYARNFRIVGKHQHSFCGNTYYALSRCNYEWEDQIQTGGDTANTIACGAAPWDCRGSCPVIDLKGETKAVLMLPDDAEIAGIGFRGFGTWNFLSFTVYAFGDSVYKGTENIFPIHMGRSSQRASLWASWQISAAWLPK